MKMITISQWKKTALATTAIVLTVSAAHAQQGGGAAGGPGGTFGRGGNGQRGGGGGFGQMMGQRDLNLLQVPLPVMTTALTLTEDQQTKIKAIQDGSMKKRQEAMSAFRFPGGGGPGGRGGFLGGGGAQQAPPPPGEDAPSVGGGGFGGGGGRGGGANMEEMRAQMEKLQTEETRDARSIQQLLTEEQKTALVPAMREWKIIQQMGLPLEVASELKLTEEQKVILEKQFGTRNSRPVNRQQGGGQGFGGRPNQ